MGNSLNSQNDANDEDIAQYLVQPSLAGPGVCRYCRSWANLATGECHNCRDVKAALGEVWQVVPISLYEKPSELRDWLKFYKPSGGDEYDPAYGSKLTQILSEFLNAQMSNIEAAWGPIDGICVVPSTKGVVPHPLCEVYNRTNFGVPLVDALVRGKGPLRHRFAHRDGFECTSHGAGLRVLLLDDVYTTGATAQSAAYALKSAGYEVPGILTIARRINPDFTPQVRSLWERCSADDFNFNGRFV
ncbi:putative amidophosphoribosyltransferase [Streptomyces sp. SAI-041]|nr:putative amidophosphoribosyltransferase [Streptomyces sp. SAI-041]